ncbi:hypothetical protein Q1695_005318 [Nippostrongylus brasiliensis]|nr:hypothetical protein Q1695_005318 [Nippostrongylus brasiliensis]
MKFSLLARKDNKDESPPPPPRHRTRTLEVLWPSNSHNYGQCEIKPAMYFGRLPSESACGPDGSVHRLGYVHSVDILLPTMPEARRRSTIKIKLDKVPLFLVNAFNFINKYGLDCDGLFRREGSHLRLNQNHSLVYMGGADFPEDFNVHDVCTMVKRFLRSLHEKLLWSDRLIDKLLELAERPNTVTRQDICSLFEPEYEAIRMEGDKSPNSTHLGTLGYLLRQLQGISQHEDKTQMSSESLAQVFVPALFGDEMCITKIKRRPGQKDDKLRAAKELAKLRGIAVELLILHAQWIGLTCGGRQTRNPQHGSSSVGVPPRRRNTPIVKRSVCKPAARPVSEGKCSANSFPLDHPIRTKPTKRSKDEKTASKRKSSAIQGFITGISDRLLGRSPTRVISADPATAQEVSNVRSSKPVTSERRTTRRPIFRSSPRHLLFEESPPRPEKSASNQSYNTRSQPGSNASSRQASSSTLASSQHSNARAQPSSSIPRLLKRNDQDAILRRDSGKKRGETSPPRGNKILRNNSGPLLEEEPFGPARKVRSSSSQTTSVTFKTRPNAVRSSNMNTQPYRLQFPQQEFLTEVSAIQEQRHGTATVGETIVVTPSVRSPPIELQTDAPPTPPPTILYTTQPISTTSTRLVASSYVSKAVAAFSQPIPSKEKTSRAGVPVPRGRRSQTCPVSRIPSYRRASMAKKDASPPEDNNGHAVLEEKSFAPTSPQKLSLSRLHYMASPSSLQQKTINEAKQKQQSQRSPSNPQVHTLRREMRKSSDKALSKTSRGASSRERRSRLSRDSRRMPNEPFVEMKEMEAVIVGSQSAEEFNKNFSNQFVHRPSIAFLSSKALVTERRKHFDTPAGSAPLPPPPPNQWDNLKIARARRDGNFSNSSAC